MSSHSYHDRSHFPGTASSSSSRHTQNPAVPPARQASYSSLNEALGGPDRQVDSTYYRASNSPNNQMSSDGRYMYQHQPAPTMASYDYPAYATTSYDAQPPPPFPQNSARPPRTASAQSHSSPQQGPYTTSPAPYHPSYGSASYAVPQTQPQWNGESWTQYQQFVHAPVQEQPIMPGPGRPEVAPIPVAAAPQRAFIPSQQQHSPTVQRGADPPAPAEPPHKAKRVKRDKETATRQETPPSSTGLDFHKLLDSYRVIIETTTTLSNDGSTAQGRPTSVDAIQRMMQAAMFGSQMLGTATGPPPAAVPVPESKPGGNVGAVGEESEGNPSKRQKSEGPVPEGQTCLGCNATSTPEWRKGPLGPRTLCNACGLVYAKLIKKRNRDAARRSGAGVSLLGRTNDGVPLDEGLGSSGEEDEDSYTSQDLRDVDDRGGRG